MHQVDASQQHTKKRPYSTDNMAKSSKVYIGEYSEDHLLKLAKKLIQQKTSQTRVFDKHAEASVPQFQKSGEHHKEALVL
jgi:hypothetical protein